MSTLNIPQPQSVTDFPLTRRVRHHDDEIDLFELLRVFLHQWKLIAIVPVLCALAGLAVSHFLPQKWTSNAVIVRAESPQMMSLDQLLTSLAILDINPGITPDSLLTRFIVDFDSQNLREAYLSGTEYFKRQLGENKDPQAAKRLLSTIAGKDISVYSGEQDKAADKKNYDYLRLSFTASGAQDASALLSGYIGYVSREIQESVRHKIQHQIDFRRSQEQKRYQLDLQRQKIAHEVNITRLKYALSIATAAGVKTPVYSNGATIKDDPDFSIALGAHGLSRKLEIEQAITDLSTINAELQNRRLYLQQLEALDVNTVDVQPFRYLQSPSEPIKRDAPKRALIVALFALIGLIGVTAAVLLRHYWRERMKESY
ncbi:LPS O-antigen length regulator Wzz(fepE) [Enterobacillus tribolii]|uniref:LPS O-antigen subunit length determinant protein (WzzB/FepE family) n=1 Tax=Enterobacillus tribolii TaxID=1487935 RepID=A0A370QLZ8_9GAMM|nr:LPS O-antigen length regulator Wzz(fepE) [Enterobacillus tribolii]MBW7982238.1 LPS O-antigen length regulator [Enterobacillus tribolii]RDK89407.1 LPS O-antigen subunit length determinant protein (WzzB/FepE family) [Enterobacillus tribolii]